MSNVQLSKLTQLVQKSLRERWPLQYHLPKPLIGEFTAVPGMPYTARSITLTPLFKTEVPLTLYALQPGEHFDCDSEYDDLQNHVPEESMSPPYCSELFIPVGTLTPHKWFAGCINLTLERPGSNYDSVSHGIGTKRSDFRKVLDRHTMHRVRQRDCFLGNDLAHGQGGPYVVRNDIHIPSDAKVQIIGVLPLLEESHVDELRINTGRYTAKRPLGQVTNGILY